VYDDDDDDDGEEEGRFRKRRSPPPPRGFLSRAGRWIVGAAIAAILPLAASLWALSSVTDYIPMLRQRSVAAAAGTAAVVALSFSIALLLELYFYWKMGPSAGRSEDAPIRGRRQFLLVYVLVPLVPGLVAGYVTMRPATGLSEAIDWVRQPSGSHVERQVGQAIQDAAESETRVAGIRALAQFGSADALGELSRLAAGNPRLLDDRASFDALAGALASFGSQAEPVLQSLWKDAGHHGALGSGPAEERTPADLALAAYSKLDAIADAASACGIAREAAAAPSSGPERQAAALAAIATCGSRNDATLLASFLVNRPEPVKRAALDAMRHLDARLRKQDTPPATNASAPAGR